MALTWHGAAVLRRVEAAARFGIDKTMAECVKDAKAFAPVDTGALQGSIMMQPARKVGRFIVGLWGSFDINYALYQELGTARFTGRRYLGRAADQNYGNLARNIRSGLR